MSYEHFRAYLELLKAQRRDEIRIHWPVIDIEGIDAQDHSKLAGLQLADAVASAFAMGLEPDFYGNCESRYAEILKPKVYSRNGNYLSYGFKVVPRPEDMQLNPQQLRTINLFR